MIMEKQFTVVCQHCGKVLLDKGTEKLSHGDCLEYHGKPCSAGMGYFKQLAKDMEMDYNEMLDNFRKRLDNRK